MMSHMNIIFKGSRLKSSKIKRRRLADEITLSINCVSAVALKRCVVILLKILLFLKKDIMSTCTR